MRRSALFLAALFASAAWAGGSVEITDPRKVAALTALQEKIDSISAEVTECTGAGTEHGDCLCESEALILDFNGAVRKLFEIYPDLDAMDLVSFRMPDGMTVTQSLTGIRNQARMKLSYT
jgi:hypothetical protein